MSPVTVGLIGASGATGNSIIDGLLAAGNFEIIALTRASSLSKATNLSLQDRGITLRKCDLDANHADIVTALEGIEVLISAIAASDQLAQIPLATAAKAAGVKRFVPCGFVPIMPPSGMSLIRDVKETVYNHIKTIKVPYTIIDVGWWYQLTVLPLPSGKTSYAVFGGHETYGDGNVLSGLTDLRDIGRYVARIIADDRTLNKYVFAYNELWSQNQIIELFAQLSGEQPTPKVVDQAEVERRIASAPADNVLSEAVIVKISAQYALSWGIRGDNTPEYAKFLGYLDSKDLYPDLEHTKYANYVKEVLDGRAKPVYEGKYNNMRGNK